MQQTIQKCEDLGRHSKKCLAKELKNDDGENNPPLERYKAAMLPHPMQHPKSSQHLAVIDSDNDDDIEIIKVSKNLENNLLCSKTTRQTLRFPSLPQFTKVQIQSLSLY